MQHGRLDRGGDGVATQALDEHTAALGAYVEHGVDGGVVVLGLTARAGEDQFILLGGDG